MTIVSSVQRFLNLKRQSALASGQDPASREAPVPKTRRRLFTKYVGLFVAVVCVALLSNGIFDVFFYYQEHKSIVDPYPARTGGSCRRQDRPVRQGDREPARLDNATTLVSGLD